jgi:hypothetical protein
VAIIQSPADLSQTELVPDGRKVFNRQIVGLGECKLNFVQLFLDALALFYMGNFSLQAFYAQLWILSIA